MIVTIVQGYIVCVGAEGAIEVFWELGRITIMVFEKIPIYSFDLKL